MCNMCFSKDRLHTTTTFTVNYKDSVIVVKNVPCLECPACGEQFFTDETSDRLEKLVNEIKKTAQEIAVIDYDRTAA